MLVALALALGCAGDGADSGSSDGVFDAPPDAALTVDGTPDAASASGVDTGPELPAPDVASDTPDPGPWCGPPAPPLLGDPPLQLPHAVPDPQYFEESLCQQYCHWGSHCGDIPVTGDCSLDCDILLKTGRINNAACYVVGCQPELCLGDAAIPTPPACVELCSHADTCTDVMVLGLTPAPSACEVMCAGTAFAIPSFAAALDCMAPAVAACDMETAVACLADGAVFCPHMCGEVGGCDGGAFSEVWATRAECIAECSEWSPAQAYKASKCFLVDQCQADLECFTVPVSAGCQSWGEALHAACGDKAWPPTVDLAGAVCESLVTSTGMPAHPDPFECFANFPRCPQPNSRYAPCVVAAPEECDPLCDAFCECELMSRVGCEAFCVDQFLSRGFQKVHHALSCVEAAQCKKYDVLNCLISTESAPWECGAYCDGVADCPGYTGDAPAVCQAACEGAHTAGDSSWFAEMVCVGAELECGAVEGCRANPAATHSAVCAEACKSDTQLCHHIPIGFDNGSTACQVVCAQLLVEHGKEGDATAAQCIAGALDHDCLVAEESDCFGAGPGGTGR